MGAKRDLRWVADATHRRSSRRPTVGFFDDLPWVVFEGLESPLSTGWEEGLAEGLDGDALTRCSVS